MAYISLDEVIEEIRNFESIKIATINADYKNKTGVCITKRYTDVYKKPVNNKSKEKAKEAVLKRVNEFINLYAIPLVDQEASQEHELSLYGLDVEQKLFVFLTSSNSKQELRQYTNTIPDKYKSIIVLNMDGDMIMEGEQKVS